MKLKLIIILLLLSFNLAYCCNYKFVGYYEKESIEDNFPEKIVLFENLNKHVEFTKKSNNEYEFKEYWIIGLTATAGTPLGFNKVDKTWKYHAGKASVNQDFSKITLHRTSNGDAVFNLVSKSFCFDGCIDSDTPNPNGLVKYLKIDNECKAKYVGDVSMTYYRGKVNDGKYIEDGVLIYRGEKYSWGRYEFDKATGLWKKTYDSGGYALLDLDNENLKAYRKSGLLSSEIDYRKNSIRRYYPNKQIKYEGDFKGENKKGKEFYENGKLKYEGFYDRTYYTSGKFYYPNNDKFSRKSYEGEFIGRKNTRHGKGELIWNDGGKYVGEFKKGYFDGYGTRYYSDGDIFYQGNWKGGRYHGKGKLKYKDGYYFEGKFSNNEPTSIGKIFNPENKLVFEGNYIEGKCDGLKNQERINKIKQKIEQERLQRQITENPREFYKRKIANYFPNLKVSAYEQKGSYKDCTIIELSGSTVVASVAATGFWGDTFYRKYKFNFDDNGNISSHYRVEDNYKSSRSTCYEEGSSSDYIACGNFQTVKVQIICDIAYENVYYYGGGSCNDGVAGNCSYLESGYYLDGIGCDTYLGKNKEEAYKKACNCD